MKGCSSISSLISAIDYVTANAGEVEVVNLSLDCHCTSSELNTAINAAVNADVTFVVAAGNDDKDASSFSPANHPNVIAVSAIVDTDAKCGASGVSSNYGKDDLLASFSNYGNVVDIAASGVSINSTYKSNSFTTRWNKYGYTICNWICCILPFITSKCVSFRRIKYN